MHETTVAMNCGTENQGAVAASAAPWFSSRTRTARRWPADGGDERAAGGGETIRVVALEVADAARQPPADISSMRAKRPPASPVTMAQTMIDLTISRFRLITVTWPK